MDTEQLPADGMKAEFGDIEGDRFRLPRVEMSMLEGVVMLLAFAAIFVAGLVR
jgi:hypothetical protein